MSRVTFERRKVVGQAEHLVLGSGLLSRINSLRFAHLSRGEYLAACEAVKNLDDETTRWVNAHGKHVATIPTREALPMAWAMAKERQLAALFATLQGQKVKSGARTEDGRNTETIEFVRYFNDYAKVDLYDKSIQWPTKASGTTELPASGIIAATL